MQFDIFNKQEDLTEDDNNMPAKKKRHTIEFKKIVEKGNSSVSEGLAVVKKGILKAKDGMVKTAEVVRDKSKEAQMAVLTFVDKKKNARFLQAKLSAFEDGMKEGKVQAVDYIKKYTNFCLASAAISYYFARCDGRISEEELLEIEHDLDSIIKNKDLPEALKNQLAVIAKKKDITFDDVKVYLDGVGIDTLKELAKDIDEIIFADDDITLEEQEAKEKFEVYYNVRLEAENQ